MACAALECTAWQSLVSVIAFLGSLDYANNNGYYENSVVFKPEPGNYKNRIITWMTLWPLSFLWTMLNDPIVRFFQHIYYEIAGVLRKISDNVFKDVNRDFEKEIK